MEENGGSTVLLSYSYIRKICCKTNRKQNELKKTGGYRGSGPFFIAYFLIFWYNKSKYVVMLKGRKGYNKI